MEIDISIHALKNDALGFICDNVAVAASSCLRGSIIAPVGRKLVCADLSAIEGRVLAWLAGEQWKIDAYAAYDAGTEPHDMYELTYAKTFGIDPDKVTKAQRQLGKVLELALGYGGGVGAFLAFAKIYRIDLEELAGADISPAARSAASKYLTGSKDGFGLGREVFIACDGIKRMWRDANPNIAAYWWSLEDGFRQAVRFGVESKIGSVTIDKKGSWARIQLPSGRFLCYPGGRVNDDNQLDYWGMNQYTRKWERLKTYSGKTAENVTQAVSRDILGYGMTNAENAGYEIVLTVHDEIISETPDTTNFTHDELSTLMATAPDWCADLPLAAAGFESYRYRKD